MPEAVEHAASRSARAPCAPFGATSFDFAEDLLTNDAAHPRVGLQINDEVSIAGLTSHGGVSLCRCLRRPTSQADMSQCRTSIGDDRHASLVKWVGSTKKTGQTRRAHSGGRRYGPVKAMQSRAARVPHSKQNTSKCSSGGGEGDLPQSCIQAGPRELNKTACRIRVDGDESNVAEHMHN